MTDDASRCSLLSTGARESLAGSAAVTRSWLLVEQPARWQRDAADSPHPDHPDALTRLVTKAADLDVRLQLLRRPVRKGAPKDAAAWVPLVVLVTTDATGGRAAQARLRTAQLDELADGGALDALVRGELPDAWEPVDRLWAVCTHGRRDVCCAVEGRALVAALEQADPGKVWETTHTGGHRFAPNVVAIPDGLVYGRVPAERVPELVTAQREQRVVPDLLRGRAALPAATQVAETALRAHLSADGSDALVLVSSGPEEVDASQPTITRTPSRWTAAARQWRVVVDTSPAQARPVSCGAVDTRPMEHTVVELTDVEAAGRGASGWDARHRAADVPTPDDADARVREVVDSLRPGRAIDLACGTGRHALALARGGWAVTAVDFSRSGLAALERAANDLDITTVLADARVWSPDDEGYDLVLASFVHLPGVLERATGWLRPGGSLVVVGHAVRNLTEGVGGPTDVRLLHDRETLTAVAERSGLRVERCDEVTRSTPHGPAYDVVLVATR